MPTTTSPQWNELNTTKTSTSTSQPPGIIATIQSTIYVTKTVISHSSSVSSSMGNSAIATPDNSAPDSVNSAAKATLYKTSTITLVSGIVIITSEPATIFTPNNEPSKVQLQAVATSSVASMDKGLLPTTEYDPLDCSWFYFCTNFATISGTLTRVTCLCSSLYITHVTTQAITDSGPSTVYTTTTAYTTVTPASYTLRLLSSPRNQSQVRRRSHRPALQPALQPARPPALLSAQPQNIYLLLTIAWSQ